MVAFNCFGHENILALHKTTIEFTKDKELTLQGDCIVGVGADFDLKQIKNFIQKNKKIKIIIEINKLKQEIIAEINPAFNSETEMVIRKSDYTSKRTFAINADKAAIDLDRGFVEMMKDGKRMMKIIIEKI